ncbi:2-amino-4-hydroxy-6-hydroxymethyldihydropteridine diphosphokinase [Hyphomonas chukchiensis]|uniref:2-amino-4-hydroxy-6- hydroxymethyldihydropteridine diphosphokinase n=1 Tax=Hyphomonas chukchiensis TaxID=1280947 RepID=UPI00068E2C22|nr:2-amino-4-hydroxy-6-hydroxymethyldihydropteridine diphosphokinase [Hyphomonas chukchiensis]
MAEAALGLGSNMGDRVDHLVTALRAIESIPGCFRVRSSSVYRTRPWGKTDQDDFLNLCALIETDLAPLDLLAAVKGIERDLGRVERERWGPREIDIDILTMDGVTLESDVLTLPHARINERLFVLMPLAEIAPGLVVNGVPVKETARALEAAGRPDDCVLDADATDAIRAAFAA